MSSVYEELVDYAEILVNIVNRKYLAGNQLAYLPLLSGVGNCRVESRAGAGHNYQAVIDAIHNCYRSGLSTGYDDGFRAGIDGMIRVAGSFQALQSVVNVLFYQLKLEKEGRALFQIDSEAVVQKLNAKLVQNHGLYTRENSHFAEWMDRNAKYAAENFGIQIG